MANPYIQVGLTYIRHLFRRGNFLFLIFACPMLFMATSARDAFAILPLLMCIPFLLLLFVSHVAAPFADWRAHLTPNFRHIHAVVAVAATFIVIVVLPAMLALLAGCSLVAAVAIVAFLLGATLWSLARGLATPDGSALMMIVVMGYPLLAVACVLVPSLRQEFIQFMSGQLELQAIALICIGLVMIVLGGMQLSRLDNDVLGAQYYLRGLNAWGRQNRGSAPWADLPKLNERTVTNWLVFRRFDGQIERLAEHARRASTSRWSAVCRWRVGMSNGWTSWLLGVGVVIAVEFAAWAWAVARGKLEPSMLFWLLLIGLIACPSVMSLSQLIPRNYLLGYEIMLPVARQTYLREIVMAFAISHLRMWGGMYTGFMLWWFTAAQEPLQFGLMANVLACSALAQVGLFGVGLCIISLAKPYSPQMVIMAFGAIWGVLCSAIAAWVAMLRVSPLPALRDSLWPLAGAGLFAMFGLLLIWLAYRRWLVADFD
jgi:hypothetical protein